MTLPEICSGFEFADGDWVESKDQDPEGEVRLIQLADIGDGIYVNKSRRRLTAAKARELNCTFLKPGDVLISRMADPLGRACIFPGDPSAAVTVVDVCIARPNPDVADPRWLVHAINSPHFRSQIGSLAAGTTRARISRGNLATLSLGVPQLEIQRRIVAKLDAQLAQTRAAREQLEAVPALVEQYRQSVLAAAFRGDLTADWRKKNPDVEPASKLLERIRIERRQKWEAAELAKMKAKGKLPSDDKWKSKYVEPASVEATELPALPPSWTWASVEELCPYDAPAVYGIIQPGPHVEGGVPYIRPLDIDDAGSVRLDELKRTSTRIANDYTRSRLKSGDVVLSIVGTIGKVLVVNDQLEGANITQSSIRIRPPVGMPTSYLHYVLQAPVMKRQYDRYRFGNAVQRLNVEHVRRLAVPLAPAAEAAAVVQLLGPSLIRLQEIVAGLDAEPITRVERVLLATAFSGGGLR